jgi:hypothetical protein
MKITDAVIRDLYVLVQAGEASGETRALVEAWLAEHPDLAAELSRQDDLSPMPAIALPAPDGEFRALRRAKRLLSMRSWSMALGFFFTGLPLSFAGNSEGVHFLLIPSHMGLAALSLVFGIAAWITFVRVSRALRPVGF